MNFSQRLGIVPSSKQLQIDSIDIELKNGLWNGIKIYFLDHLNKGNRYSIKNSDFENFCLILWHNHYKSAIDTIPLYSTECEKIIRDRFFNQEWYKSYDLIDFLVKIDATSFSFDIEAFKEFINQILENEFSGFRFIGNMISPISNSHEIKEIEFALNQTEQFTSLKGANIHLISALEKLSDRNSPDYRNSIKESISAVEAVAKLISQKDRDTLNVAIDRIKSKIHIHNSFAQGIRQFYNYTSDDSGIRHSLMDEENCFFEDAQFMLVACSAFINYLFVKAEKTEFEF